jgi:hypothetical protein
MNSMAPHIFFFLSLTLSVILFGLTVFAFSAPVAFAHWFTPWHFLSRTIFSYVTDRGDRNFAFAMGGFCLVMLLSVAFALGSFFVHALSAQF